MKKGLIFVRQRRTEGILGHDFDMYNYKETEKC